MTIPRNVLEAANGFRSPVYVYDLDRLGRRCDKIDRIPIHRKSIFFATMANDHPDILAFLRDRKYGVFVNSMRHLRLVLGLGFAPRRVTYAASNMTRQEIAACLDVGVRLILDSVCQLQTFAEVAGSGCDVGIRLNVGSSLDGNELRMDPAYRFGLLADEIPLAVGVAARNGIRITGAHSYFGTDIMDPHILIEGLRKLAETASELPDLEYLDAGGGFGVPDKLGGEQFDIRRYGREAALAMDELHFRLGREIELVLEPGRYLVAECGFFFVQVTDVKVRQDAAFVGTNGSVALFPRPLLYPERAIHPCELVQANGSWRPHTTPVYICGNSTYSRDFLARKVTFPLPRCGDTVVFHNAGAYCRSTITEFLGKDRPAEIVLAAEPTITSVPAAVECQ